jgi:hypothetical protein
LTVRNVGRIICCVQITVQPWIERSPALCTLYQESPCEFWGRLMSTLAPEGPQDDDFIEMILLVVDGAHRRYISVERLLPRVWVRFLLPTMSFGQMVTFCCHQNA